MGKLLDNSVLVLNASYEPIHICGARRAVSLVVKEAAHIEHDAGREVYAGIMLPTVIRLKLYRKVPCRVQVLTRRNVILRDRNTCQYCNEVLPSSELTLDHVLPRSRGGQSTWQNLVAACGYCNREKANRTPEEACMPLLKTPRAVTLHTARHILRSQGANDEAWRKYLYY